MAKKQRFRWPLLVLTCWALSASIGAPQDGDAYATDLLERMSAFLQTAEKLTYVVRSVSSETLDDGVPFELATETHVAVRRPDRFWVDVRSEQVHNRFLYDGDNLQVQHLMANIYASTQAPGTIDDTLVELEDQLGIFIPLADIIANDPYPRIMEGVESITYLGVDDVDGVSSHHVFVKQADLDWQIWIEDGRSLVPRKIVFNFKGDEGNPTFTAFLTDWDFSPHLPDAVFAQSAPADADQVEIRRLREEGTQ